MAADDRLTAELAAIKDRADKASPGPWEVDVEHGEDVDGEPFSFDAVVGPDGQMALETLVDLQFAAHAREDVPRLVKALEAAQALAAEWVADADELDRDIASARKSRYKSDHEQADTDEAIVRALRGHAEAVREVIASALTGTETT